MPTHTHGMLTRTQSYTQTYTHKVPSIEDKVKKGLEILSSKGVDGIPEDQLKDFKKRKLINNVDLTPEMIQRYDKNSKQSTYTHKHSLGLDMTTKISNIVWFP